MNDQELNIILAAMRVVQRYGVSRSTMNDVAVEAGVSRQTVYAKFANKNELTRAMMAYFGALTLESIRDGLPDATSIEDKIELIFEQLCRIPWRSLQSMPDSADFILGMDKTGHAELEESYAAYRVVIEEVLEPYAAAIEASGLTTTQLSSYVQSATAGIKKQSRDAETLEGHLTVLKAMILTTLQAS